MIDSLKQRLFEVKEGLTLGLMTGLLMALVLLYISVFVMDFFRI